MKKRLPLFIFATTVVGSKLIENEITKTTDGNPILKTRHYVCERDCNGVRIFLQNKKTPKTKKNGN